MVFFHTSKHRCLFAGESTDLVPVSMMLVGKPETIDSFIAVSSDITNKMMRETDLLISCHGGTPIKTPMGMPDAHPEEGEIVKYITYLHQLRVGSLISGATSWTI